VADGVHAPLQWHEPPAPDAVLDGTGSQPGGPQLRRRHDAVLSRGERRDGLVPARVKNALTVTDFSTHVAEDRPTRADSPASVASRRSSRPDP
jgi:hypothetical protein